MIAILEPTADLARVRRELVRRGIEAELHAGLDGRRALLLSGPIAAGEVPGIAALLGTPSPHPLVDRAPSGVDLGDGVVIGGPDPVLIAGPCAVEDEDQIQAAAAAVARAGGSILRGGAWKPRTSPYSFAGLGAEGLRLLRAAADRHALKVVSEVLASADVAVTAEHADLLQIGSRTMQAFDLLRAVGRARRPVLLKRGMAATVEEWLLAAEHLLAAGAPAVVLCERGIRAFAQPTRNTLDLGAVAYLRAHHRLPVLVDPSHAAGRRELVRPLARAAIAAGAQGVMIEMHPDPAAARSDGLQAVTPSELEVIAGEVRLQATGFGLQEQRQEQRARPSLGPSCLKPEARSPQPVRGRP